MKVTGEASWKRMSNSLLRDVQRTIPNPFWAGELGTLGLRVFEASEHRVPLPGDCVQAFRSVRVEL